MKKSGLFIVSLAMVFAPIGLGFWVSYILHSKNWIQFCLIALIVITTYLWIEALYELSDLRKKLKDYERKLILKDDSD